MKNTRRVCAASCALGMVAGAVVVGVLGAAQPQSPAPTPVQAPAAAPAQPAPAADQVIPVGKARALLGLLAGSWQVRGTTIGPGGANTGPFEGQCHFGWTLGGTFLAGDHVLYNQSGAALQMMDVMGFTPGVGFTRSEITNGDPAMFQSTGVYDEGPNALVFTTENPMSTQDGKRRSLDTMLQFRPDGTIVWDTTFEENDSPTGTVKLVLSRIEGPSAVQQPTTPFGAPMVQRAGGTEAAGAAAAQGGFIVQTPQGLAVTRPPQSMEENKQLLSAMLQQRQQLQAQMNAMQGQVQDMSRMMNSAAGQ